MSKQIEVVATEKGFYKGRLRVKGEKFTLESEKQLGRWMKRLEDKKAPDDTEKAADLVKAIATIDDVEKLQGYAKDSRQTVKRAAEKRLESLSGDNGEADKLKAEIAESEDLEKLQKLSESDDKEVAESASKRLEELKD